MIYSLRTFISNSVDFCFKVRGLSSQTPWTFVLKSMDFFLKVRGPSNRTPSRDKNGRAMLSATAEAPPSSLVSSHRGTEPMCPFSSHLTACLLPVIRCILYSAARTRCTEYPRDLLIRHTPVDVINLTCLERIISRNVEGDCLGIRFQAKSCSINISPVICQTYSECSNAFIISISIA